MSLSPPGQVMSRSQMAVQVMAPFIDPSTSTPRVSTSARNLCSRQLDICAPVAVEDTMNGFEVMDVVLRTKKDMGGETLPEVQVVA